MEDDFCFRRLTITGQVSELISKNTSFDCCLLYFLLTVDRSPRLSKVLRAIGEVGGIQLAAAERIRKGSIVTLTGCLKEVDPFAVPKLNGFDLEHLLEVWP